jgi:hypothetical protein
MIFARTALAARSLETLHFGAQYCRRALSLEDGGEWGVQMNAQATKLEGAENDLKQLMADVTRAMEKAQEAVARIAPKAATPITEAESMSSSRQNSSS